MKQSLLLGCSPCLVLLCSMIAMTDTLPPASFGHSHHKWHPSCALAPLSGTEMQFPVTLCHSTSPTAVLCELWVSTEL